MPSKTLSDSHWATDITTIPLQKGFFYLVAIVDLFSRNVLSWKLTGSLDTEFCLDALQMALAGGRKPEIFHSDQGYPFTSADFVTRLQAETIKISWSGRKRCYDNILVKRLWRTVKYVAEGLSAKPSRGGSAWIQRWLGGGEQPGPIPLEDLPCQAKQPSGRQNSR